MKIPVIAAREEVGRLGVVQLKRYWSRMLARRAGERIESEDVADTVLLCGLHAGVHETTSFLMQQTPGFAEFEEWILGLNGGAIEAARVQRINTAILGTIDPGGPPVEEALTAEELEFWDRNGYVVVHDAVTSEQARAAAEAIYEFLEVDPGDPETWYGNPAGHSIWVGLLRHPAFQANRESQRIHAAFAQLWGRTDLWASIDQGGFNPPERPEWPFPGPYLHWDTSIAPPVRFGVQGILYLTDTAADQGAFQCVPGFHKRLEGWLAGLPEGTDPRDRRVVDALGAVPIAGRAGDLIIWHHALPHGASPNRSARPRVAQYIRMVPSRFDTNPVWR